MSSDKIQKIAGTFTRLGWIGVWVQAVLMIIPLSVLSYILLGKVAADDTRFGITDYLAMFGLAVLAFTLFWSYRYTRLGKRIADPKRRPQFVDYQDIVGGVVGQQLGHVAVSLLLMIGQVRAAAVVVHEGPTGRRTVMQTQADDRASWVSALDVVSLLAELCTLMGELLVVGLTLWLLYRIVSASQLLEQPGKIMPEVK